MARSVIGLDVGTAAVRAAELRFGRGRPALVRFAQVALDPGAVVAGEVVDAAAVGAALRRLWKEGGFTSRKVVTGISGSRVVARTTELPALSDAELRSSLPFQVQELIPIPVDEAVIDHQVLERLADETGERVRVLVVAAHRDVVRSLVAALEAASLEAVRVDLIPFALIRALHERDFAELADGERVATAEAIVDVGGGVTNVLVHEHGVPRFLRSLSTGGVELTEALATDLGIEFAEAEALKRRTDGGAEVEQARTVFRAALAPVLEEIRTSLDFWLAQSPDEELRRVIVTGGAAIPDEVIERLERLLAIPVVRGRAFGHVDPSPANLDDDQLARAESVATVAVGLALSGEALVDGNRRISLLPVEIEARRRERRQVVAAGAGVAAFAALLLGVYALRSGQVSDAEAEADAAEARTSQLQAQVAQLQDVEQLEADIASRRETVQRVLSGDVAWVRLIQEVATVMPDDVWLTTFAGSRDDTGAGEVTFGGMGFDQTSTAHWLIRVADIAALNGVWVPSSTLSQAERELVTFTSSARLTPAAASSRIARYGAAE